ncbi:Uma2 family endonuclease [Flavisolibacter nicotianae]|uniref:Uma2 family endonuclease n=1 Tax=Flavisolibacter nicotianae TaxID=2364882 RepID=UPI0013C4E616|nr:Uma2 family endonuclease [Flavisolibacter nicotianae]
MPHYTYDDYVQWEGKWELIDGIPHAMSPAPTPRHQVIAVNLSAEFRVALKRCKYCKVSQPVDYKVAEDTILQPDMLIICGDTSKAYLDFPPALVAEILSPSTALKDRHGKFALYEQQKVPYYIIISPDSNEAEVYVLEESSYVLKQKGNAFTYSFSLEKDCSATIDFSEIWK